MFKGYRTLIFNILVMVPSILIVIAEVAGLLAADPYIRALIPPEVAPSLLAIVAAVNIILRSVTTTPVGRRE